MKKVIEIPAEPADPADLPPLLQGFKAVPPLVTDINLSLDDRQLYVSCWGTGELRQYDVSDPFAPRLTATTQIGGIVRRAAHPAKPNQRLNGGPQMVELSRDGRRVYLTNGLYSPWDPQFYPDGLDGWMVKLDARPEGGMAFDPKFFLEMEQGLRSPPGAAPGRRRLVRLLLLLLVTDAATASWPALLALGAGHGINPAMGWLFAVALGLQRGTRRAVWALARAARAGPRRGDRGRHRRRGHGGPGAAAGRAAMGHRRRCSSASALYRLVRARHITYGGMRANGRELATWSFLMASAHGAGLMVLPLVLGDDVPARHAGTRWRWHPRSGLGEDRVERR